MATRSIKRAHAFLGGEVDERSVLRAGKTRLSIDMFDKTGDITQVQVPPRPPKRRSKDRLFFCQSILPKTEKTPWIPMTLETMWLLYILCDIRWVLGRIFS